MRVSLKVLQKEQRAVFVIPKLHNFLLTVYIGKNARQYQQLLNTVIGKFYSNLELYFETALRNRCSIQNRQVNSFVNLYLSFRLTHGIILSFSNNCDKKLIFLLDDFQIDNTILSFVLHQFSLGYFFNEITFASSMFFNSNS